jgi:outer membrane receptor protein involved in Fe transport
MFDATLNWRGSQNIPSKVLGAISTDSPAYSVVNAQISKEHKEKFEVYVGVENLLDFKQDNPIIMAENPNDPSFDASLVWGPIFGRNIYFGIRMTFLGEAKNKATSH